MFDFNHPFYRPLWIRVTISAFTMVWGLFEFSHGAPFWGTLFCGISAITIYAFFFNFKPREPEDGKSKPDGDDA